MILKCFFFSFLKNLKLYFTYFFLCLFPDVFLEVLLIIHGAVSFLD